MTTAEAIAQIESMAQELERRGYDDAPYVRVASATLQAEVERLRKAFEVVAAVPSEHDLLLNAVAKAMHYIAVEALGEQP